MFDGCVSSITELSVTVKLLLIGHFHMLNLPKQQLSMPDGTNPMPKEFRPEKVKEPKTKAKREPIPARLRNKVLHRDGYTCKACGANRGGGAELHIDHIVPVADGGRTCEQNLQTLCGPCNLGKGRSHRNPPKDDKGKEWRIKKHLEMTSELAAKKRTT